VRSEKKEKSKEPKVFPSCSLTPYFSLFVKKQGRYRQGKGTLETPKAYKALRCSIRTKEGECPDSDS